MTAHVLATFTDRTQARAVVDQARAELPDAEVRLGDDEDALDAMALGQRQEMAESVPVTATGVVSGPFARGAVVWGGIGLVVGAVLAAPFALLIDPEIPLWSLVLYFAAAGGLALASAAFILGAGRQAVKEGATTPQDPTAVVRVDHPGDPDEARRWLVAAGARSSHTVDRPVDRAATGDVESPRPMPGGNGAGADADELDAGFRPDPRSR